jgi:tRNA-Thr(GGU) m(6)t(6)A37 methyltransferase TsaA
MKPTIQFIGIVRSPIKDIADCPLQENENAPAAEIVISPPFITGTQNLKPGSKILILTWLHLADRNILICKPRNNPEAPDTGVFSTRSPDRPNPIGIHTTKIINVSTSGVIQVEALEVLDQTPVVDIKPVW